MIFSSDLGASQNVQTATETSYRLMNSVITIVWGHPSACCYLGHGANYLWQALHFSWRQGCRKAEASQWMACLAAIALPCPFSRILLPWPMVRDSTPALKDEETDFVFLSIC
jgi:hypothetical protein